MPLTYAPSFGTQLRELRERASWTQAQLACAIGVTRQWLNRVEADEEIPTLQRVEQLHRALTLRNRVAFADAGDQTQLLARLTAAACDARIARWQSHLAARAAELRELAIAG